MTKRFRIYLVIILACLLMLLYFDKNSHDYYSSDDYFEIKNEILKQKDKNGNLVDYIKINNSFCFYNKLNDSYLFSVNGFSNFKFNVDVGSSQDISILINSSNNSIDLNEESILELLVYNDKYYYVASIEFTTLPIISITTNYEIEHYKKISDTFHLNTIFDSSIAADNYKDALFLISDPYYESGKRNSQDVFSLSTIKLRGHDSLLYDKKSYKLNLKKNRNNLILKNNVSLLGMYSDDDWILDALYVDYSKIRNKLASDLWRLISNYDVLNVKYVELFLDNEYKGLYALKEPINKKSLNASDGAILKSILYINDDDENIYTIDNNFYTLKYFYDFKTQHFMFDKLNLYYDALKNEKSIDTIVGDVFDIENIVMYKAFVTFIKGVDNDEYNNYYYSVNYLGDKVKKTPWDMDLTFGLTFNMIYDYDGYNDLGIILYYKNSPQINALIKDKYWELRNSSLNMDTINHYLDGYKEIIIESGASLRDSERWYDYDIDLEIEKIREWCFNRINFLDDYFSKDYNI